VKRDTQDKKFKSHSNPSTPRKGTDEGQEGGVERSR
jgi:hypothetical protein